MPTYEYKCDACGKTFERFQSIMAAPIKTCPFCGKHKVKRLIGAGAGLIFKGSGFYQTDYPSESYKSGAKSAAGESKPAADSKPAETKAADSKPAAEAKPAAAPAPKSKPTKKDKSES